jgi:hypothetical protein
MYSAAAAADLSAIAVATWLAASDATTIAQAITPADAVMATLRVNDNSRHRGLIDGSGQMADKYADMA